MAQPQAGIHLVHKPAGVSSFSLVKDFIEEARAAGIRPGKLPACHGGTLDPFAEGLLLILAGKATRLMDSLHAIPKEYEADIAWGAETDNGDPSGKVTAQGDASTLTTAALEAAVRDLVGWREQVPPLHSNKRVGGERAYQLAWRGESVELPPARVYLHEARWLAHDLPRASGLRVVCGGGYYLRSLARDLGRALGCRAHLRALRRAAIGPWRDPGLGRRDVIAGAELLPWCASRSLSEPEAARVRGGHPIPRGEVVAGEWTLPAGYPDAKAPVRALFAGRLLALLEEREGELWPTIRLGAGI